MAKVSSISSSRIRNTFQKISDSAKTTIQKAKKVLKDLPKKIKDTFAQRKDTYASYKADHKALEFVGNKDRDSAKNFATQKLQGISLSGNAEVGAGAGVSAKETFGKETVYTVKKGDTLSKIAAQYGTTWQELARYNNISNPDLIFPDQKIKIPPKNDLATPQPLAHTPAVGRGGAGESVYTVKKGDTLSKIAARYGTTWRELARYNNISNPDRIYPGQQLRIPTGGQTQPTGNTDAPAAPPANTANNAPAERTAPPADTARSVNSGERTIVPSSRITRRNLAGVHPSLRRYVTNFENIARKLPPEFTHAEQLEPGKRVRLRTRDGMEVIIERPGKVPPEYYLDKIDEVRGPLNKVLDVFRQMGKRRVVLTSLYREPRVNEIAGGAEHSQHRYGKAVDIAGGNFSSDREREEFVVRAYRAGFRGFGAYDSGAVHVDTRRNLAYWGSSYRSGSTPRWLRRAISRVR